jgi:hypothetical protein
LQDLTPGKFFSRRSGSPAQVGEAPGRVRLPRTEAFPLFLAPHNVNLHKFSLGLFQAALTIFTVAEGPIN